MGSGSRTDQLPTAAASGAVGGKKIGSPFAPFHSNLWWTGLGPGRSQGSPLHTLCCYWNGFSKPNCAGGSPGDSVLEPELGTLRQEVKGDWLLLMCHFLDALQGQSVGTVCVKVQALFDFLYSMRGQDLSLLEVTVRCSPRHHILQLFLYSVFFSRLSKQSL